MRKFTTGLLASALAISMTAVSLVPAGAAPVSVPKAGAPAYADVVQAQAQNNVIIRRNARREARQDRREFRRESRQDRREFRREARQDRREFNDNRRGYYRGYRGYREYRPGYRRQGDFWYPAAAFLAGAIVTGAIANSQARPAGNAHVEWCYDRYKSYRASDNTFQPYNGPRQQCYSPY